MSDHCDIAELLPGGMDVCPVCATTTRPRLVLNDWDDLRARTTIAEPEPFILRIPA